MVKVITNWQQSEIIFFEQKNPSISTSIIYSKEKYVHIKWIPQSKWEGENEHLFLQWRNQYSNIHLKYDSTDAVNDRTWKCMQLGFSLP
jgi:hypothetical protein